MRKFTKLWQWMMVVLLSSSVLVAQSQKILSADEAPSKIELQADQLQKGLEPEGPSGIMVSDKIKELEKQLKAQGIEPESLNKEKLQTMALELVGEEMEVENNGEFTEVDKEWLAQQFPSSQVIPGVVFDGKSIYGVKTTTVTLGTGTSVNTTTGAPTPYGTYYKNFRQQYLILASELTALGVPADYISALGFNVSAVNNCSPMPDFTISMKHTTQTTLTTTFEVGTYTQVYYNPSFLPVNGWNTHDFCTQFYWDGVQNILIDICTTFIPGSFTQNASVYYTATSGNTSLRYQSDSSPACGTTSAGTTSTSRANMQITYGLVTCPAPTALTATNITTGSADLGWTPCGTETLWNLEWGAAGFTPGTGTLVTGLSSPSYSLSSLTALTGYDYYVQADCGTDETSAWAGPKNFMTLAVPLSGVYTINSGLPTGGTNFINFTDFAIALNQGGLSGPVTANVVAASGPYTEQIILNVLPGSSTTNTLTINGNGETLQYLSANTNERATFKMNGTDYVTVNNLIFKSLGTTTSEYGFTVQLMNSADYNTFNGCQFIADGATTSSNYCPFVTSNSATGATTSGLAVNYLTVNNCIAVGGYYGMVINGPTATPYSVNNNITNNEIKNFYNYGLYIRGQNNSVFSGNEISRPDRIASTTEYMVYLTSDMSNSVFTKNRIFDFSPGATTTLSAYGIYGTTLAASLGQELLIANNVIYGYAGMNGINYGMYFSTTSALGNLRIYHNSVSVDNIAHPGSSSIYAFYHTGATANLDIKNNIFAYTTNSTGTKYCMYFSTNTAVVSSNYNDLYRGAIAGTNNTGYWSATAYNTLANWQTANGGIYDLNSVADDPLFVAPASGNLSPSNPALNNIGTNLLTYVPDDINGVPRTATPDPGAYEFVPASCLPPSLLPVTTVTSSSADLQWVENNIPVATEWDIEVVLAGVPPSGIPTAVGVTSNPYTVGELDPATEYDWYVRAACSPFSNSSWAGPGTFSTACEVVTEFNENFDALTTPALPACWAKVGTTGSVYTQTSNNFSAPNCLYIYSTSTSSIAMVSLPEVSNAGAGTHWLRFQGRANLTIGGIIEVGYLTDPLNQATFTAVQSLTMASLTYAQYFADLGTAPGSNTFIALRHTGSPANSVLIDNVVWEVKPSCPDPYGLAVTNITMNSADISWTSFSGLSNVEYGLAGFTPGVDPIGTLTGVTSPQTLSGLSMSTNYEFYVQDECITDEVSNWVGPVAFTTKAASGELLYQINVEAITGDVALLAAEYFNGSLWLTGADVSTAGSPHYIYQVDYVNGTLLNTYLQGTASAWGMRDLANDGTYLYAGDDNGFYRIDPTTGGVTTLFTPTGSLGVIRALAYNPVNGHFWTKNFSGSLYEFDATGTIYNTYTFAVNNPSTYGAAWDPTGPWLWLHSSTVFSSEINEFVQVDPATGALTGVSIGVPDSPCSVTPIVGGGFMDFGNMYPGKHIFGALLQATPDVVHIVEAYDTGFPNQSSNFSPYCGELDIPQNGTLTWDFGTNTATYDLWFGLAGAMSQVVTAGTAGATGSYIYSGLLGSSVYEWQVVEHNATGTTMGLVYNFNTVCDVIAVLPWTENFDAMGVIGTNIVPSCWKTESTTGTPWASMNAASVSYNDPYSSPNYVTCYYSPYTGVTKYLITPGFALTIGTSYEFSFKFAGDGYSGWTAGVWYNTIQSGTGSTQLGSDFISGGTSSATYADVLSTFVPPATGTYYFMVKVVNTVSPYYLGFDNFELRLSPYQVSGTLSYGVPGGTPIDNSSVLLYDYSKALVGTYPTDANGDFAFNAYPGNYNLSAATTKPRGGTNILDAINTRQFLGGSYPMDALQQRAANVNNNTGVDILDAIFMQQSLSGPIPAGWTAPDWLFQNPEFVLSSDLIIDFQGLCSGDPNRSYAVPFTCLPPTNVDYNSVTINSVVMTWNTTAASANIKWGPQGFTGAGNPINDVTSPYLLNSGLAPGTVYDFYVQSRCSSALFSEWVGPITFTTANPQPAGTNCANPYIIASLPFSQTGMTTCGFGDDYNYPTDPGACYYYINGEDFVFEYTPATNVTVTISLTNTLTWTGINVSQGCPDTGTCVGYAGAVGGNPTYSNLNLTGGVTYYIIIGTWPTPDCTPFDIIIQ
jgi:hypothetical protein